MKQTIALIREGKVPHDKRVALTPAQCVFLEKMYPNVDFVIQPCEYRCIPDSEYIDAGLNVSENISGCDIFIGIKEVPKADLIPGKIYLFFSHTIKKQPHNKDLLKAILEKKIQLIDYECLVDEHDNRIIGFGRFAGIVGAYNTIRAYGLKYKKFKLKPAHECEHKTELEKELRKVKFDNIKILLTGGGRVTNGALEMLGFMKIRRITSYEFLKFSHSEPTYTQIHSSDYNAAADGQPWNKEHFYHHPEAYVSTFNKYASRCDILMHCAFWNPKAPVLFTKEEMKESNFKIRVIGDITCDINGSIPSTTKSTTIDSPYFEYDQQQMKIIDEMTEKTITTMAVDNLPCSLPRDASEAFGNELIEKVLPSLFLDRENDLISRASITLNGKLTERYQYLTDYVS